MNDLDAKGEDVDVNATGMNASSVRHIPQASATDVEGQAQTAPPEAILAQHEDPAAALEQLGVGTVVDGKYRIDAILGRGAMGVVVAATHLDLRETVALKFLNLRMNAKGDDFHLRFRREAQLCAKLRSEHVARVIDVGVWQERTPYMVMEHLVGMDLSQILKARGPLPLDVALEYIVQVCQALAEAHGLGVVHRDLKPSNLFLTQRHDGSDLVKVLDFGISKWSVEDDISELTQSGVVLGSPKYMAAEQLFGSANVDARADVWSIGAIFYTMLTGKSPYDFPTITRLCAELATGNPPPSLREKRPEVPAALDAALMRCFERDRDRRVQNVSELAGDLLDAVEAPFAEAVRAKILASLDPKKARDANGKSGPRAPTATGQYRALNTLSSSSSGGFSSLPGSLANSGSGAVLSLPQDTGALLLARSRRDRNILIAAVGAAVVALGALSIIALSSGTSTPPAAAQSAQVTQAREGTAAAARVEAPAAITTPTAAALPTAAAVDASSTPLATGIAAPAAATPDRRVAPAPRPAAAPRAAVVAPAATPKTVNTPPEAAPAPAPAATPEAPKKKGNPLEERQ